MALRVSYCSAAKFGRFRRIADIIRDWREMARSRITQRRHPAHRRLNRSVLHGRRVKSALRKDREKFTLSAIKKRGLKRNAWAFPGKEFNGRATRLANSLSLIHI